MPGYLAQPHGCKVTELSFLALRKFLQFSVWQLRFNLGDGEILFISCYGVVVVLLGVRRPTTSKSTGFEALYLKAALEPLYQ
jgi:hypothetical protein